jgi:hypothetical protein
MPPLSHSAMALDVYTWMAPAAAQGSHRQARFRPVGFAKGPVRAGL